MGAYASSLLQIITEGSAKAAEPALSTQSRISSELDSNFSGEAKLWAVTEKLLKENPSSAAQALPTVLQLLRIVDLPEAREFVVRALRTETPSQFSLDPVRAECFKALGKFLSEHDVAEVFFEELERNSHNSLSCKTVVAAINEAGPIKNQNTVDRVLELILLKGAEDQTISELAPKLGVVQSGSLTKLIEQKIVGIANGSRKLNESLINTLALSGLDSHTKILEKLATSTVRGPVKEKGISLGDCLGISVVGGGMLGILGVGIAGLGNLVNFFNGYYGTGTLIGLGIGFVGLLGLSIADWWNGKRIGNEVAAKAAISALSKSAAADKAGVILDRVARTSDSEFEAIGLKATQASAIREAALKSLSELGEVKDPALYRTFLTSASKELKLLGIRRLGQLRDQESKPAILALTKDNDLELRRAAYQAADEFKRA